MLGPVLNRIDPNKKAVIEQVIFNDIEHDPDIVNRLPREDKQVVQQLLAQKIAYETINDPLMAAEQTPLLGPYLSRIFFCLYPETCIQYFNVNTQIFMLRCKGAFSFWRSDFLNIAHPQYDLYGPLWISITYACLLAISGNIAAYWANSFHDSYQFQSELIFRAFGVVLLFSLLIPFALGGIISLMGGNLPILASVCMYGYSQLVLIVPAFLCSFPSLTWQVGILVLAGLANAMFLLRNYYSSTKLTLNNNVYPLLVCIITFEILYLVIIKQAFFLHNQAYLPGALQKINTTLQKTTHNLHYFHTN